VVRSIGFSVRTAVFDGALVFGDSNPSDIYKRRKNFRAHD